MSINAAITHRTRYDYDWRTDLGPQIVGLRPAPHSRTRILSYSQKVGPEPHFPNWQRDPFGNYFARLVFPEKVDHFEVTVDLVADMAAVNPFDFFVEDAARSFPFAYNPEDAKDLAPHLETGAQGTAFEKLFQDLPKKFEHTVDFLVAANARVRLEVDYLVRMEPGVQTPEETLRKGSGSCRDSGWLLVHLMRRCGLAARFVSGHLIQLTPDIKAVDGPSGPAADFTDLHAWCEVYVPGAGWIGLDPTSGLLAGEGHVPLACTPSPRSAAPITGAHEPCGVEFSFHMDVRRVREEPRVSRPFSDDAWSDIDEAGRAIDAKLAAQDVRLTMGGEPTFVAAGDRDAPEWNEAAVRPTKRLYADRLIRRLRKRFAPGGVIHHGQGKWYPGEQLPHWAFGLYWRRDGEPLWLNSGLIATEDVGAFAFEDAERFARQIAEALDLDPDAAQPAYEDPATFVLKEAMLPENLDPANNRLDDPLERMRLARGFEHGLGAPVSMVLPAQLAQSQGARDPRRRRRWRWATEKWRTRRGKLFLAPGDSAVGYRLPLTALPSLSESDYPYLNELDPFAAPDSPFLRRPDLLASLLRYWQNHPSLSFLFSGQFIGPTSQAPRMDEARDDILYEMEIALAQVPAPGGACPPWLVDRIFRNLLTDATGNTHRAEICIDKLYSPDGPTGRLGLVEFRAFEMPPHPRMSLAQALVLRALIARFWDRPYEGGLIRFGPALHDRFMPPHFVWTDFLDVLEETGGALGLRFDPEWVRAQFEVRFPLAGDLRRREVLLEVRSALEPWHVLGETGAIGGAVRYVDSSLERVQIRGEGDLQGRFAVACNGYEVPLTATGRRDEYVAGVRYRAWRPAECLHPTIGVHAPLRLDLWDRWSGRSLGGCMLHAAHPGGRSFEIQPVNDLEAEGRRMARFDPGGHQPGGWAPRPARLSPEAPLTLDLRRQQAAAPGRDAPCGRPPQVPSAGDGAAHPRAAGG